jgi:hypothetical protein
MPQAAQGSGYPLQSFLKKNQKRISIAIPHAKEKHCAFVSCGEKINGSWGHEPRR